MDISSEGKTRVRDGLKREEKFVASSTKATLLSSPGHSDPRFGSGRVIRISGYSG